MTKAQQKKQEMKEVQVVADMARAKGIADVVFGVASTAQAVFEIYGWVEGADEAGCEAFKQDLKQAIGYAQTVFETMTPTPEQVFGIFDAIHDEDEDEE